MMKLLELFCGTKSISNAFEERGHEVYTVDWEKDFSPTLCADIGQLTVDDVVQLCGGKPDVIWASPDCTSYSVAGIGHHRRKNTETGELDTGGIGWKLFEKYCEALHNVRPRYFLYENNYGMPETIKQSISEKLGVQPIMIDSALVSAQNRKRLYWTNIPNVEQPKDKGIKIKDIIVDNPTLIKHFDERIRKTIQPTPYGYKYDLSGKGYYSQQDRLYCLDGKAPTIARCRTETKFNVYLGNETYKKLARLKRNACKRCLMITQRAYLRREDLKQSATVGRLM